MNWQDIARVLQLDFPEIPKLAVFFISLLLALLIGRYTPGIVRLIIRRFSPNQVTDLYENLIDPIRGAFKLAGTLILVSLSMAWLQPEYQSLFNFFSPFVDLGVIAGVAWLASRLFRQFVRVYGIDLLKKLGREADELLLVVETLVNVIIGFISVLAFAQSQRFNLIGLMASLGIGGLAVAFAAQKILEQLLSTVVLYLDRPFVPGEYIRLQDKQLGRVESIGLRSTKIRTAAKSTLIIVPNSTLMSMDIENVSRAKKVMVLLYMDFTKPLTDEDAALVRQVVSEGTDAVFGIDPGSTSIAFTGPPGREELNGARQRARVTFFILGSNENSIQLRKRLLELANETIAQRLSGYGIKFTVQEPTMYVESPVTM
ncbi:putative Small Conductance Mechanosensitive Ion Channel protein [Halomicronema hongdechloris C2206]|uniref:Small Conductance Mechanosensitive Ion Channel protein n=1 Tax=Halomicronema hongdechloris C2206 TaxID=1641165 RepID=A0A1Z3HLR8_9CYAN|nr:mechanosensitive ion channel domain-containing protein [Halomicronema hongdechloris]ASC71244.1 putative Small Conductance Mechanosensitive Ion Channel protein [Halomicronema hongdechloris C2206]